MHPVRELLLDCLRPASQMHDGPEQILVILRRLMVHYPSVSRDQVLETARWEDWIADLEEFPLDVIALAAVAYRRSPQQWAPTPGQLVQICAKIVGPRASLFQRIQRQLDKQPDPPPLDDEDREALARIKRGF